MLTERIIRDAKPTGKAYTLWDSVVAGLGLQMTQAGKRNFVLPVQGCDRAEAPGDSLPSIGGVAARHPPAGRYRAGPHPWR